MDTQVAILVPKYFNDGKMIPFKVPKAFASDIVREFGGLTIDGNSTGYWENERAEVVGDTLLRYTCVIPECDWNDNAEQWFVNRIAKLCHDCDQDCIFLQFTDVHVRFIDRNDSNLVGGFLSPSEDVTL